MAKSAIILLSLICWGLQQHQEKVAKSFKITEQTLSTLRSEKVPESVLRNLERIKNKPVFGEEKFLQLLIGMIGEREVTRHGTMILEHALDLWHEEVAEGEPTRFELSVERETYYLGEPMRFGLVIHNQRDIPIKGSFERPYRIYYRKTGSEFVEYEFRSLEMLEFVSELKSVKPAQGELRLVYLHSDGISYPRVLLPQGMWKWSAEILFYNAASKNYLLAEPGTYEFKATYPLKMGGSLESPVVRVAIAEPPMEERDALVAYRDVEIVGLVLGAIGFDMPLSGIESAAEKAGAFLQKYPKSIYAPIVEERLRQVLKQAEKRFGNQLTPRLKAIKDALPDR